jgi:hypothetical protein
VAHWRPSHPQAQSGLPFGVWWALGEALTVPALLLGLKLLKVI